ncbi:hypothetical protein AYL99_07236 [Fonsecaea erecta]|uniref:Uncharacterized protein n=1 Tax=Fonsecaea erecta TaxID=1367422 RepID=A0A178ZF86_9EURO|nr:hypothetical protein AYL99_07236 [Fonsecaea erecta]OAP58146.1 hypothetical protein AYL99_07236 [Fonsecaea erecta]
MRRQAGHDLDTFASHLMGSGFTTKLMETGAMSFWAKELRCESSETPFHHLYEGTEMLGVQPYDGFLDMMIEGTVL